MPLFQVDIEKRLGSEFWSNRYITNAVSLAEATTIATGLVAFERDLHATDVTFTRYRASSVAMNDGIFVVVPINQSGEREGVGTLLPLFNTLRIDIPAQTGRPSRKFYRGVLTEGDINGELIASDFLTLMPPLIALMSTEPGEAGLVDPQGEFFNTVTVYQFVQMRQLRRSRRKRTNGGGIFQ